MKIGTIKATGEWVVLKAVKVTDSTESKTAAGITLPNGKTIKGQSVNTAAGKEVVDLVIEDIGPCVPSEKVNYKKGDIVIVDNYDLQAFGDDEENNYGIVHYTKVKSIVTIER